MRGIDGEVYGIAQGSIVVSGFGVKGNDGSKLSINVPSSGRVPNGATVERDWALWWQDAAWLTPYFTLAVWISIVLVQVPSLRPAGASGADRRG